MSTYLLLLMQEIWDWILAPPLHWALSLSLEWKLELGTILFAGAFWPLIIEHWFIGREQAGILWAERLRIREWYHYADMPERDFRAVVASLRERADKHERLSERLEDRSGAGFRGRVLWRASVRRQRLAQWLRDEADRLERLWQAIEKERSGPGSKPGMQTRVLRLMRRLNSLDERTAVNALAELNRISGWFDWESLAPKEMTGAERTLLGRLLRLMADTTSVGEARNAYSGALRMLQQHNWEWQWERA